MKAHVDITGKHIIPGDFIVYAANAGRSAILKIGIVESLGEYNNRDSWRDDEDNKCVNAITVDYWPSGNLYQETGGYALQNNGKPVRLTFSERLCVIPTCNVPAMAHKVLFAAYEKYKGVTS